MCNVYTQYAQRWCHLYSQASEQSSDTNVINQRVIVESASDVTVLLGKQSDGVLMQVDVSDSTMHYKENGLKLWQLLLLCTHNSQYAFVAARDKNMFCRIITILFQNCKIILSNT